MIQIINIFLITILGLGPLQLGMTSQEVDKLSVEFSTPHILFVNDQLIMATTNTGGSIYINGPRGSINVGYNVNSLIKNFGYPDLVIHHIKYSEYVDSGWLLWDNGFLARILETKDGGLIQQLGVYSFSHKKDVINYLMALPDRDKN